MILCMSLIFQQRLEIISATFLIIITNFDVFRHTVRKIFKLKTQTSFAGVRDAVADHSAILQASLGPDARISSVTCDSNSLKFFTNIPANFCACSS